MKRPKDMVRSGLHRFEYFLTLLLSRIVRILPPPAVHRLGDFLGVLLFRVVRVRREVTLKQLGNAFPEKTPKELDRCGAACYKNLAKSVLELVRMHGMTSGDLSRHLDVKGRHYLDEALERGKGVVVVTFHFGNWELMGAYMARLGYPLSVIVQRIHNPYIDRMIAEIRSESGMKVISKKVSVRAAIKALKKNDLVVLLADQDAHESGVFVPFFGRPASTPRGPAVLSFHLDTPAVMAFMVRKEDGNYEITIEPIRYKRQGDLEEDVVGFTRVFTARLEDYVRAHPDQWLWQHRRWKTVEKGAA